jgi:hypothetical protein
LLSGTRKRSESSCAGYGETTGSSSWKEAGSAGKLLWQDLAQDEGLKPVMVKPFVNKEECFNGCLAEVEAGHFLQPVQAA